MKKSAFVCILCVFFVFAINCFKPVFALYDEIVEFEYAGQIFCYQLSKNIKYSNVFDVDYEINKYKRFNSYNDRQKLIIKMLNCGFDLDVIVEYVFPNISNVFNRIQKVVNIDVKDARLEVNTESEKVFFITKEVSGVKMDKQKMLSDLINKYINNQKLNIKVPIQKVMPECRTEDYQKFTNLRSDFSTDISSSSRDRKHNVKNALNALNKVEIYPNEIFSFNKVIGKRTKENGYREAKIIVNNEFVDGIGGGVCQVSTTLYNSALLAGLEILEANKHSKQVSYVKYGFDAMVNFGSSDLKFRNNTNQKLTIVTNYTPNKARIRIFGEDMNNTSYRLVNEIVSITEPTEEIEYDTNMAFLDKVEFDDEFFYLKKASKGMEVKSYREKYVCGQLQNTEMLRHDKFKVQNAIKVYGIKKRTELNCA